MAIYVGGTLLPLGGTKTIWVPANDMTPTESDGCSAITQVEGDTDYPDYSSPNMYVLNFDKDDNEHAQFTVAFPKSWNLGTITYQVFWSGDYSNGDGVEWGLQGRAFGDGDGIMASMAYVGFPTATLIQDSTQGYPPMSENHLCYVTAESGDVTIAGSPADDDLCYFQVLRNPDGSHGGTSGADDMSADARLHGIKLFFTTDAANDD
jgi:hypothetical protein